MVILKKILVVYLFGHILFMLIIGFSSFSSFIDETTFKELNPVGQFIVKKTDMYTLPKQLTDFVFFYSIYTGTNRGYSFFSPNISPTKVNILFMADGKEINLPFKTQESRLKYGCTNLHLSSKIFDKEEREIILKSLSSSLFSNNPDIEKLDIYLDLHNYTDLKTVKNDGYNVQHKRILGFSALKNNVIALEEKPY